MKLFKLLKEYKGLLICLGIIGIFTSIYLLVNKPISKLVVGYIFITIITPIMWFWFRCKYLNFVPNTKTTIDKNGRIEITQNKQTKYNPNKHQKKEYETNLTNTYAKSTSVNQQLDSYINLKTYFNELLKNRNINRETILNFKNFLNNKLYEKGVLGHYNSFNFENEAHEIYIKLKNKNLVENDYIEMLDYLKTETDS